MQEQDFPSDSTEPRNAMPPIAEEQHDVELLPTVSEQTRPTEDHSIVAQRPRRCRGQLLAECVIVLLLTLFAGWLRVHSLDTIPPGLHGDEAWTGVDARRILEEGWIGPYVPSALGQPTGPLYFVAPVMAIFGDSVGGLRLGMAWQAILAIPLIYLMLRVMFDQPTAFFGAFLLSVMLWHLHYSRIAFMVVAWPTVEIAALLFLFLGFRRGAWKHFVLAGIALGYGLYTYNAYPLFAPAVAVTLLAMLFHFRGLRILRFVGQVAAMGAVALVVAAPLLLFMLSPDKGYTNHHSAVSITGKKQWEQADFAARRDILVDEAKDFFVSSFWSGWQDAGDGLGERVPFSKLQLALLVAGVGICLWKWKNPATWCLLVLLLTMPVGAILTTNGTYRRTLGILPALVGLSALPLGQLWRRAARVGFAWRGWVYVAALLAPALIGVMDVGFYFSRYPDSEFVDFVFCTQIAAASRYIDDLPDDTYVYFYSDRWSYEYETRVYLAPDAEGMDCAPKFSEDHQKIVPPPKSGPTVYVFLAPYLGDAEGVMATYPGGQIHEGEDSDGRKPFRAYFLPEGAGG